MKHLLSLFFLLSSLATLFSQTQSCAPVLGLLNGLSAPIGLINTDNDPETEDSGLRLHVKDFIKYAYSPCNNYPLKYTIRMAATGTGLPADTTILFDCTYLGTQVVEVWVEDAAGNSAFAETYVIVHSPSWPTNMCSANPVSVSAACTNDKLPPLFTILSGLSTSLLPGTNGNPIARVSATDFIQSKSDNCTGPLRFRIRKCGAGTGVPNETAVSFDESELGTQCIEIWCGDLRGNWTTAESYLLIENPYNLSNGNAFSTCNPDNTPPEVLVFNGLTIPITLTSTGPGAEAKAVDFIRKKKDNCSVPVLVRIARHQQSMSPPPTSTAIKFTCDELGWQPVDIWVRDLAGNWSKTETYVLVQDNSGDCGPGFNPRISIPDFKKIKPGSR